MRKGIYIVAALLGLVSVIMGAMGAHIVRPDFHQMRDIAHYMVVQHAVQSWQTGVVFMLIHAVASIAIIQTTRNYFLRQVAAGSFTIGSILFAGSIWWRIALYGPDMKPDAASALSGLITAAAPIGGTLLMLGWMSLIVSAALSRIESY